MLSENVQVWLRSFTGIVSVIPAKCVKERLGKPQVKGVSETPVIPKSPATLVLNAYRLVV